MSDSFENARNLGKRIFGSVTDAGRGFAETSGISFILPILSALVAVALIAMVVFVAIQMNANRPSSELKGPIMLFDPKTPVIVDRPTVKKALQSSYTLSMYLKLDAVPDMRLAGTPLLKWPKAWNVTYNAAKEQIEWEFFETGDTNGAVMSARIVHVPHITLQKWNQVAITFEGRTADIYCNGELITSTTLDNVPPMSSSSITIVPTNVMGQIAYVQTWPRRFTMGEIATNYTDTSDSQGRPYLGPEFLKMLESVSIPNLFNPNITCQSGNCDENMPRASQAQKWEFPYQ